MNTILLKENDLEINAYLDEINVNQSFEEDDTEDDEFLNPSGSVLQPACNPYNKQRKIAEANETLFSEEVAPKSPQKVKFDKVEKRICYDYFGSSFESDSIKSCEDEESEKESLLQPGTKQKNDINSELKSNYLQPQNPANKVVVTVTSPKREEQSESESEDVCVGIVPNLKEPTETNKEEEIEDTNDDDELPENEAKMSKEVENEKEGKDNEVKEKKVFSKGKIKNVVTTTNVTKYLVDSRLPQIRPKIVEIDENNKELGTLEVNEDNKIVPNSSPKKTSFYPCLANHTGITIRITGADSIESVESESTDNEVQIMEKYNYHQSLDMKQDSNYIPIRLSNQNIRSKVTTLQISEQTFILKGIKSNQNIRSPKHNKKLEQKQDNRTSSKSEETDKVLNTYKKKQVTEKTEKSELRKADKHSSKIKNSFNHTSNKSKPFEDQTNKKAEDCLRCTKKVRPKSCLEKGSTKEVMKGSRPVTAPAKRPCCPPQPHLPEYNGLRSEYGLSAEQLVERKRHKVESQKMKKQRKEQKWMEEQQKRKENEEKFIAWLENKRKQAQMQFLRNQKIQAESGIKIYPAPTSHLKRTGAVRSRKLFKSERKCVSLEEILSNANSHENKTYKIYLGLSFE